MTVLLLTAAARLHAADLFLEAESFEDKGGWVLDQQFMDLMGSPYLMAHGMGVPVTDARTRATFPEAGTYHIYVRTYNWTSPWFKGQGPGAFEISVGGDRVEGTLGVSGDQWEWQGAGTVRVSGQETEVRLHDLTGFNGRCDAIYFTTDAAKPPPSDKKRLASFRKKMLKLPSTPESAGEYDLVVIGGGVAGICASVSAARLGLKVALVHDRPVLGGNNSSEARVHLGGRIEAQPYPQLGNLIKEFGPVKGGNAQPAAYYEDEKKDRIVAAERNITLHRCYRAIDVRKEGNRIIELIAKHLESSREISLRAPVFSDCTGDGTVGALAGADFAMGREGKAEFNESTAPDTPDKMTMGASVQWYSVAKREPTSFPVFRYGLDFNARNSERVTMGEWTWETGMNQDQLHDFERIRDYGLLVIFSNWSYLKNEYKEDNRFKNRALDWVAYVAGKRESRRLLGDYILTENDITKQVKHEDGTASTTWSIDLHYPDPKNTANFPGREFRSIAVQNLIHPYPVPYRCLYSRNIANLFMAGRNISVTHVALGSTRVMRTTGMLGEVVGMAASLCKQHGVNPRGVYERHLAELRALMKEGVGKKGLPNNQIYNQGGTLGPVTAPKPGP